MPRRRLAPLTPGTILREDFMRPMGLTVAALACATHASRSRISAIVNGRRAITADTALRLGKFFGVAPETWMNLQADYDLRVARDTSWRVADPTVATYRVARRAGIA